MEDSSCDHYSRSNLERYLHLNFPLAFRLFAQPDSFKFVSRYGYPALKVSHTWSHAMQKQYEELYFSNTNYGAELPPILRCHSDRFERVFDRNSNQPIKDPIAYIKKNGFVANDFWRQVFGHRTITVLNNRFHAVFQLVELVCGHRKHYVGSLEPLKGALRACEQRLKMSHAAVDTPMDEQLVEVEDHEDHDSDDLCAVLDEILNDTAETFSQSAGTGDLGQDEGDKNDSKNPHPS